MDNNTAAQLLGERYSWSLHTVPVQRLIDYITMLESRLNEAQAVKPCECP